HVAKELWKLAVSTRSAAEHTAMAASERPMQPIWRPDDHYFEIPRNVERRAAWLKRISRQGTAKGSPWQPASRSVVCSRHFIDKDYREGCKRKLLRSSAIPTVFPEYPSYLQGGDCPKRRKLSRQENDGTQSDRRSNQE
ncbi:hypothetical protein HPB47_004982, partial [Ixodes persulcatus]